MYNANNYGYNPYGTYIPQRPIQQPVQPVEQVKTGLNGKQVESIEVAKNSDIPFDGSVNYFPILDGSAIVSKQLTSDGTIKTLIFKQSDEDTKIQSYITNEDLNKAMDRIDLSEIDDLKEDIRELRQEIKEIKKKKKVD